jgi:signal recognition particle subunit SRP54
MPHTIDGKRRLRIANGSGTTVQDVNQLLEARKMMEKMMGQVGKGKMPSLPGMGPMPGGMPGGIQGGPPAVAPLERRSGAKKRKANKRRSGRR